VLLLAITLLFSEQKTLKLIHRFTSKLPERFRVPIEHTAGVFSQGLHGVRTASPLLVVLGTLGIWFFYSLSMYVSFFAFREMAGISFSGAVLLRIISGVAFLIPTPGGTGSYHFFISQALVLLFGVEKNLALTYATLTHASNFVLGTVLGLFFLLTVGISFSDVSQVLKKKKQQPTAPLEPVPTTLK
jgi:glycosyltransferase 2 family protein